MLNADEVITVGKALNYCGAFARACRPRSVMMYNVLRSLCSCFVTYCTSTKRASPALEASALMMRPRSPAARNAFKNQISSLVKSMVFHDPICD